MTEDFSRTCQHTGTLSGRTVFIPAGSDTGHGLACCRCRCRCRCREMNPVRAGSARPPAASCRSSCRVNGQDAPPERRAAQGAAGTGIDRIDRLERRVPPRLSGVSDPALYGVAAGGIGLALAFPLSYKYWRSPCCGKQPRDDSYAVGREPVREKRVRPGERRQGKQMPRVPFKDSDGATIKESRRSVPDRRAGNIRVNWTDMRT